MVLLHLLLFFLMLYLQATRWTNLAWITRVDLRKQTLLAGINMYIHNLFYSEVWSLIYVKYIVKTLGTCKKEHLEKTKKL
jgi:hypothetical protein